jgi:hypothetical protein
MPHHRGAQFVSDEDDDDDDEGTVIYSRTSSSTSLRARFTVTKVCEPKVITTNPGLLGAGETETESEDQPVCAHLASTSQCNHLSMSFVTAAAAPNSPHRPLVRATDPPDHTATASHAIPVFLFTLALDCPSLLWNAVQPLLCRILSSTARRSSN